MLAVAARIVSTQPLDFGEGLGFAGTVLLGGVLGTFFGGEGTIR